MPMLEFLRGKASDRKLRLFACACCRGVWPMIDDLACQQAVAVVERFADGTARQTELTVAYNRAARATTAANKAAVTAAEFPFTPSLATEVATCAADAVT